MPADERFTEGIRKVGWFSLALGILGIFAAIFILKYYDVSIPLEDAESSSLLYVLFYTTMSIINWSWVVFILSLGTKYLNRPSRMLAYSNEAVLPFYMFHQTVILCVGWFVIRWDIGMLPKYLIIAVSSFVIIMVLYEGLVRHFNVVRFLFGMRPKKRGQKGAQAAICKGLQDT